MARHSKPATLASLAVILVAGVFLHFLLASRATGGAGTTLTANFTAADGIASGADVAIAGIPVGRVTSVSLDQRTMMSHVTFTVGDGLRLPDDSAIAVRSAGLTSGNELVITPGHSLTTLRPGQAIANTQDYVSLETAIGQYIFGGEPSSQP